MRISIKRSFLSVATVLIGLFTAVDLSLGQGTAFTYQGSLSDTNGPATGSYDLKFQLFSASTGGSQVGSTITDAATSVSNGLFTVVLDFGTVFSGADTWLQVGVKTNGGASYETLSPRQELTPAPYAITSENLDGNLPAVQLTGTLPSGVLSGTYPDAITLNNAGNSFTGNGSGLTGVNALTLGDLGPNNFWQTTGNAGTTPGVNFVGTTDGAALELSAHYVGINRTTPIFGGDVFSVTSPSGAGAYGGMLVDTASAQGLPFYGYSLGGSLTAYSFVDGSFNNTWFLYNNGYSLTVTTNSLVGIDNPFPEAPLDVASGNHWDVFNQSEAGDFRIAGGVGALKIGVATGGAGGGDVRVFADGGTSRLILGSSTNDGMVTVTGTSVGINTLTPGTTLEFGHTASLDAEGGTNTYGAFGNDTNLDGAGVVGEADNGPVAFGVWGFSSSGYGVYGDATGGSGIGVLGEGSSIGVLGYSSSTTGAGVLAEGAANNSPALSINQGTFQVQGAGIGTHTTAFIHFTTAGNVSGDHTFIDNEVCNGDTNAILIITHNYSPPNGTFGYENHSTGVYYTGGEWAIFNEDGAAMVTGIAFNVLVIKN